MKAHEKDGVIKRYSDRLAEFGDDPQTLGWTKGKHFLRYHMLLAQWDFKGESLLDFGCGFGDMSQYIQDQGINLTYHGVDINPDLISTGQKKYPGVQLFCDDILAHSFEKKFDFVVSSGVHNLKLEDNWGFIEQTFESFAKIANNGFALNFISNKVDFFDHHLYHTDPAQVLNLAYKYSNRVALRNDYMPFEFTVYVDLRKEFDKGSVVYPEFTLYLKG
jgi:SAM-dependent methyltransferase